MESILCILATGALCIACFLIGVKCGKQEDINVPKIPVINPMEAYTAKKEKEHEKKEMERLEKISSNVNRYDGTAAGQLDID